jgi:hypothetical protein
VLSLRRVFSDALISTAAVGSLLLVLVAADDRVRDQVQRFGAANASTALTQAGGQIHQALVIVMETLRDQSVEHAPLLIFALVATVLLLAMSRT